MFDIASLISGIVSGIVSSAIIYLLVFKVKPKIKIGNKIARSVAEENNTIYRLKVVNKSKFAIFNLYYSLHYCHRQADGIINIWEIKPSKSSLFYISPHNRKDKDDKHAVRISFDVDESKYPLDDNAYFRFTVIATHGFSNTSTYMEVDYVKNDIVDGVFETGDSVKILSVSNSSVPVKI